MGVRLEVVAALLINRIFDFLRHNLYRVAFGLTIVIENGVALAIKNGSFEPDLPIGKQGISRKFSPLKREALTNSG